MAMLGPMMQQVRFSLLLSLDLLDRWDPQYHEELTGHG